MTVESPENVSKTPDVTVSENKTQDNTQPKEAEKASPAKDLRDIQSLLVMGIFPGQMAPAVVKAYQLLEQMAIQVEKEASAK